MTKSELNARLSLPLTASQLKKISLADLQARVDALRSESNHFGIDPDTNQVLDDSEQLTPRRLKQDGVMFAPADVQKTPKPGSKRALILDMLRAGTTTLEIAERLNWAPGAASSALYVDVKGSGWGVERIDGRLFLLPREAK